MLLFRLSPPGLHRQTICKRGWVCSDINIGIEIIVQEIEFQPHHIHDNNFSFSQQFILTVMIQINSNVHLVFRSGETVTLERRQVKL